MLRISQNMEQREKSDGAAFQTGSVFARTGARRGGAIVGSVIIPFVPIEANDTHRSSSISARLRCAPCQHRLDEVAVAS